MISIIRRHPAQAVLLLIFLLPTCRDSGERHAVDTMAAPDREEALPSRGDLPPEQLAFWNTLREHCGNAYSGRIEDATPSYRAQLEGRALQVHFLTCSGDSIHVPLHVDDDRSRNWILTRAGGTIRLKHDHRREDGLEEEISQYGGDAPIPGLPERQIFPADAHTAEILPARFDNFWFIHIVDDGTLHYGVHWPKEGHSVRLVFDLNAPIDPPPSPWGY